MSGFIKVVNSYTSDLFGTLFLLGFFLVLFISTNRGHPKSALTVSAWSTAIIGILLIPLGIVNTWVIYLLLILFITGFIGLFVGD